MQQKQKQQSLRLTDPRWMVVRFVSISHNPNLRKNVAAAVAAEAVSVVDVAVSAAVVAVSAVAVIALRGTPVGKP